MCDAWPVRRQTYGYFPSLIGWYQIILLGHRGPCVNLPKVALDGEFWYTGYVCARIQMLDFAAERDDDGDGDNRNCF